MTDKYYKYIGVQNHNTIVFEYVDGDKKSTLRYPCDSSREDKVIGYGNYLMKILESKLSAEQVGQIVNVGKKNSANIFKSD